MSAALVTGAAGFIGSHVCQRLLAQGHEVIGVDKLSPYYDERLKAANLEDLGRSPGMQIVMADVTSKEVLSLVGEVDTVFHLAGQPGVRTSWSEFPSYLRENVECVHHLIEAVCRRSVPPSLVLASSSSVYGNAAIYPCAEGDPTEPVSPYGVSKLAMEQLVQAYVAARKLPAVLLRYFTVYGPRQRPDMAFHRFCEALLLGGNVEVYGDGHQVREFTYVEDVADATVRAARPDLVPGSVYNICGGQPTTLNEVLGLLASLGEGHVDVRHTAAVAGDVRKTGGSNAAARRDLGWSPSMALSDGLRRQLDWHRASGPGRRWPGMSRESPPPGHTDRRPVVDIGHSAFGGGDDDMGVDVEGLSTELRRLPVAVTTEATRAGG